MTRNIHKVIKLRGFISLRRGWDANAARIKKKKRYTHKEDYKGRGSYRTHKSSSWNAGVQLEEGVV